jgi:hypothetical protein
MSMKSSESIDFSFYWANRRARENRTSHNKRSEAQNWPFLFFGCKVDLTIKAPKKRNPITGHQQYTILSSLHYDHTENFKVGTTAYFRNDHGNEIKAGSKASIVAENSSDVFLVIPAYNARD